LSLVNINFPKTISLPADHATEKDSSVDVNIKIVQSNFK